MYLMSIPSLPSRERGLKSLPHYRHKQTVRSLPSWERGLKFIRVADKIIGKGVAPFTGAWIEMSGMRAVWMARMVAPFTGAWIEI